MEINSHSSDENEMGEVLAQGRAEIQDLVERWHG
jgi:hypothetical protein